MLCTAIAGQTNVVDGIRDKIPVCCVSRLNARVIEFCFVQTFLMDDRITFEILDRWITWSEGRDT